MRSVSFCGRVAHNQAWWSYLAHRHDVVLAGPSSKLQLGAGFEESRNASDALLSHCGPLFREQQAQAPTTPALPERTTTTTHGVERTATRERKANVSVRSLPQSPTEHTPFPRGKGHCILCVGS